ncbi:unnamed protein product, partial [Closterium sp. NIES-65]
MEAKCEAVITVLVHLLESSKALLLEQQEEQARAEKEEEEDKENMECAGLQQKQKQKRKERKQHGLSLSSFAWRKCLRYYLDPSLPPLHRLSVQIADASFTYGFEYSGCTPSLVRTSLTDRCFLALSQALWHGQGSALIGPAGTGKTETVKALGRQLGRPVLALSCDRSFDSAAVGRVLEGVARLGAWGVHGRVQPVGREYNVCDLAAPGGDSGRAEGGTERGRAGWDCRARAPCHWREAVLAGTAVLVHPATGECADILLLLCVDCCVCSVRLWRFALILPLYPIPLLARSLFDSLPGIFVTLNPRYAGRDHALSVTNPYAPFSTPSLHLPPRHIRIFVTLNPRYAGRDHLPESLSALLRPLTVAVPDACAIAHVTLLSCGFSHAERLADAATRIFQESEQCLAPQPQYDFSQRALKAALRSSLTLSFRSFLVIPLVYLAPQESEECLDPQPQGDEEGKEEGRQEEGEEEEEEEEEEKEEEEEEGEEPEVREEVLQVEETEEGEGDGEEDIVEEVKEEVGAEEEEEEEEEEDEEAHRPSWHLLTWQTFREVVSRNLPDVAVEEMGDAELTAAVEVVCEREGYVASCDWTRKVLQMARLMGLHQGIMLVGPPAGKTTAWRVLRKALEASQGVQVSVTVVDPKSLSKEALFGSVEATTREWSGRTACSPKPLLSTPSLPSSLPPLPTLSPLSAVLREALQTSQGVQVSVTVVDPKSLSKEALFGSVEATTREWQDGVFTRALRAVVREYEEERERETGRDGVAEGVEEEETEGDRERREGMEGEGDEGDGGGEMRQRTGGNAGRGVEWRRRHWFVFDGEVDPIWIETLNSLLDDNKVRGRTHCLGLHERAMQGGATQGGKIRGGGGHWFVFDGEVDPIWIETLNSLLDDNKVMTLPTGERLPLLPHMHCIFECPSISPTTLCILPPSPTLPTPSALPCHPSGHDSTTGERLPLLPHMHCIFECPSLAHATPATISRLGVVCFPHSLLSLPMLLHRFRFLLPPMPFPHPPPPRGGNDEVACRATSEQLLSCFADVASGHWKPWEAALPGLADADAAVGGCFGDEEEVEEGEEGTTCNPASDVGRHELPVRLTRHLTVAHVPFPSGAALTRIYSTFIRGILARNWPGVAVEARGNPQVVSQVDSQVVSQVGACLAAAMVEVYEECGVRFTRAVQQHYVCSPRELTRWTRGIRFALVHGQKGVQRGGKGDGDERGEKGAVERGEKGGVSGKSGKGRMGAGGARLGGGVGLVGATSAHTGVGGAAIIGGDGEGNWAARLVLSWLHEGMRIWYDRLVREEERQWTAKLLLRVATEKILPMLVPLVGNTLVTSTGNPVAVADGVSDGAPAVPFSLPADPSRLVFSSLLTGRYKPCAVNHLKKHLKWVLTGEAPDAAGGAGAGQVKPGVSSGAGAAEKAGDRRGGAGKRASSSRAGEMEEETGRRVLEESEGLGVEKGEEDAVEVQAGEVVLTDEFVCAVVRAASVLQQPMGHLLLLGPPATGKSTVARAASVLQQPMGHLLLLGPPATGKSTIARWEGQVARHSLHVLPFEAPQKSFLFACVCVIAVMGLEEGRVAFPPCASLVALSTYPRSAIAATGLVEVRVALHAGFEERELDGPLEEALRAAGCDGRRVCLVLEEAHLVESAVLERLNSLLTGGGRSWAELLESLRQRGEGEGSEEAAWAGFRRRIQGDLHVVLTMTSQGSAHMRQSMLASPALFNRCTVLWLPPWGDTGLAPLAQSRLAGVSLVHPVSAAAAAAAGGAGGGVGGGAGGAGGRGDSKQIDMPADSAGGAAGGAGEAKERQLLAEVLVAIHGCAVSAVSESLNNRAFGKAGLGGEQQQEGSLQHSFSPDSLISLRSFSDLLTHFHSSVSHSHRRAHRTFQHLSLGLTKVTAAEHRVVLLRKHLELKSKELQVKESAANGKLQQIAAEQALGERQRKEAQGLIARLDEQARSVERHRREAQENLERVEPAVDAAKTAAPERQRKEAQGLIARLDEQAKSVERHRREAQENLERVEPAVDAAKTAVKSIRKSQLDDLKAMPNPPSAIKLLDDLKAMPNPPSAIKLVSACRCACYAIGWQGVLSVVRQNSFICSTPFPFFPTPPCPLQPDAGRSVSAPDRLKALHVAGHSLLLTLGSVSAPDRLKALHVAGHSLCTLEGVCLLLTGLKPTTWQGILSVVRRNDFIPNILGCDMEAIDPVLVLRVKREYLDARVISFDAVNRASKACGPLFSWLEAAVQYGEIIRAVQPMRAEMEQLEGEAGSMAEELQHVQVWLPLSAHERAVQPVRDEMEQLEGEAGSMAEELQHVQ